MSTFGFITIGQSPRDDILNSMLGSPTNMSVAQHGALDLLTSAQIKSLYPDRGEFPLVTRLRDGTEVLVSKARVTPLLQEAANRAVSNGSNAVVILCTGKFPELDLSVPVLYPDQLLRATVDALLPAGRLGVIMPGDGQMDSMREKWQSAERTFAGAVASPYSSPGSLLEIGRNLRAEGADLIVLDCMGFTSSMRADVAAGAGVPVILANRLVGRIIEEIMESAPAGVTT